MEADCIGQLLRARIRDLEGDGERFRRESDADVELKLERIAFAGLRSAAQAQARPLGSRIHNGESAGPSKAVLGHWESAAIDLNHAVARCADYGKEDRRVIAPMFRVAGPQQIVPGHRPCDWLRADERDR